MKARRFFLSIFFLLVTVAVSAQCSMCRAVAETGNGTGKAGGLNDAIIYLMIAPYIILFVFFRKKIWSFLKELRGMWN